MKNPKISSVLKESSKANNLSVKDVAQLLKEHNNYVADKTIYHWESGETQPDADTLMLLCKLYHVPDVLETFGYRATNHKSNDITHFESELINKYRANPEMHSAIHKLLGI